ncbi:MAG: hypothetical protein GXY52_03305 [Chloroflexi bacterium]|nr:hypothetical protein [Chloroflexota bacterium]
MPRYRDAAYGGETVVLKNAHLRLEVHKRITGWGWGELYVPDGSGGMRFFAVLEHLGELSAEGLPHALRLESTSYTSEREGNCTRLRFAVRTQEVEPSGKHFGNESPIEGEVVLSLADDEPYVRYHMQVTAQFGFKLNYLRGPWLRVGADSFGTDKVDAIFPGIEWLRGEEWSSGTDWFAYPEALRVTPHPHKVSFPCLAISHGGVGLGLCYQPDSVQTVSTSGYPSNLLRYVQPVFASPNFVDRRNDHLLGLMWPSVRQGLAENALSADGMPIVSQQQLAFDAQIAVVKGDSLDVITEWVKETGMPEPGKPRWPWEEAYQRIIEAYDTHLWLPGEGWATGSFYRGKGDLYVPECVRGYIDKGADAALAARLKEKVTWVEGELAKPENVREPDLNGMLARPEGAMIHHPELTEQLADQLVALQTPEGDFPYDPNGRHTTGLISSAAYWRPIGHVGDSAIDLVAVAVLGLIEAHKRLRKDSYLTAIRRGLEFGLRFDRPEGGDWWETPLNAPNLLAAGNAAIAYYLGYELFDEPAYKARAVRWIRSVLPFTYLWQPIDQPMLYNTKPCLCSTAWFLSDWVSKCVLWEVLRVFGDSWRHGIDWGLVDPELDWHTYHRGILTAVLRWMVDHKDPDWVWRSEFSGDWIADGSWDTLWSDTFDPVKGSYGGGPIGGSAIAEGIHILMQYAYSPRS